MSPMIRHGLGNAATLLLGGVLSLIAVPPLYYAWSEILIAWDKHNPPVVASLAEYEAAPPDGVVIRMYITRQQDCDFVRPMAFTGQTLSEMHPTPVRRLDGAEPLSYPVGMTIMSRPWLLRPVMGPRVVMYAYYDCGGRLVRAPLINEVLK